MGFWDVVWRWKGLYWFMSSFVVEPYSSLHTIKIVSFHALSWETLLGIALEVSRALSYLHSTCSIPIYHRDIKSTNILLDDRYRVKVSHFGTSMSISIDQSHLTTLVQGTFGYLDLEYFQSSQFTKKSDIYSFRVVVC